MNKKILRNYLYNIIYQLLVLLVPIITAPYLARVLGAEKLGVYGYVSSIVSIVSTVGLLGVYNYGVRQIAYCQSKEERSKVFFELMFLRFIMLMVGVIAYVFVSLFAGYFEYFLFYIPYFVASYIDISWLYVGVEDVRPAVIKNIFAKVICVVGIFIFVNNVDDLWKYVLLIAAATLCANFTAYLSINKYIVKVKIDFRNIKNHLIGGIQLFLPQIATLLYLQVDKMMLNWISGPEYVSFYEQSEKIVNIALTFITVLSTVMMPTIASKYSQKNIEEVKTLIERSLDFSMFLAIPLCFGCVSIVTCFIPWYLGDEFLPCIQVVRILSPLLIFNAMLGISGTQYFTATNQIKILLLSQLPALCLNIVINLFLIPRISANGAAIATIGSSLLAVIIQYCFLIFQTKIKVFKFLYFKYAIFGCVILILNYFLGGILGVHFYTTIIQIISSIILYLILCLITKDKMIMMFINNILCKRKVKKR